MRTLCLMFALIFLSPFHSKAEVVDTMISSRIHSDPFGYAWEQYGESAAVLRDHLKLGENAKIAFNIQTQASLHVQKFLIEVNFCTKTRPRKCLESNLPKLTFNNSKTHSVTQDLSLVNLKKHTLLQMAELAKRNNLIMIATLSEVVTYLKYYDHHSLIAQMSFDFNDLVQIDEGIAFLPQDQNPFVQFQFLHRPY